MQSFIFKNVNETEYENLTKGLDTPLTQHTFYGVWQEALEKKGWRYVIQQGGQVIGFFQIIKYPLPLGRNYLYIPHGPVFTGEVSDSLLSRFRKLCFELIVKENAIFLRFDIFPRSDLRQIGGRTSEINVIKAPGFLYDGSFQSKYEWVINLAQNQEEILAGMKKVNRYTIRQAEKQDFKVKILNREFLDCLDKFYELVEATAKRDGFAHGPKEYYQIIFEQCEKRGNGLMIIISLGAEIMLINFFVTYGDTVFFLFSGSENEHRKLGYTYLAQWEVIKHAKDLGMKSYNLGAVIPEDNRYSFYKKWHGFSDFKKRFGGSLLEYSDFSDIIGNRFWYSLYVLRKILKLLTGL